MKKSKIVLCFLLLISLPQAQDSLKLEWAKDIILPYTLEDYPGDMVLDTGNNIYITGNTGDGLHADRIVVIKYTPEGNEEWINYDYGLDSNYAESVALGIDKYQNIYVSGRTYSDSTFSDYYLIKYTQNGEKLWKSRFGGDIDDYSGAMIVNKEGNGAITGWGYQGPKKCLTVRFNSEGKEVWSKWYSNDDINSSFGFDVTVDEDGNTYLVGLSQTTPAKGFLIKYKQDGEIEWKYDSEENHYYRIITNKDGSLYTFYSNHYIALSKYNEVGDELWYINFADSALKYTERSAILTDMNDNVYTAGYNNGSFVLKFDSNGDLIWMSNEKLPGVIKSIDVDEEGYVYAAATYEDIIIIARYDSLGSMQQTIIHEEEESYEYYIERILLDKNENLYVFGEKVLNPYPAETVMILLKYKFDPITSIEEEPEELIKEFALYQNYPNPFNPTTTIKYELKETTNITLKVYDSLGRLIKVLEEGTKPAGRYELQFDGSNLSSGIYFYQLKGDDFSFVKKMLLIK